MRLRWLEGRTLQSVGLYLGVTKERARQLETAALKTIRESWGETMPDEGDDPIEFRITIPAAGVERLRKAQRLCGFESVEETIRFLLALYIDQLEDHDKIKVYGSREDAESDSGVSSHAE